MLLRSSRSSIIILKNITEIIRKKKDITIAIRKDIQIFEILKRRA